MDQIAFEKAQESLNINRDEINDEISLDDVNFDEILETESIMTAKTEDENNYQIDENTSNILTPCVIIDLIDGKIQCCFKSSSRPLAQLIGTWEINEENFISTKAEDKLYNLGVCTSHFNFDQNSLHRSNLKQERTVDKSWIYHRRCLFCNKYKYFFSRGNNCIEHSACITGRNVQVPCIGLKNCSVFDAQNTLINKSNNQYRSRYICSECFNIHGGHFFERQGSGKFHVSCENKHKNDTTNALELISQWILSIAASKKEDQKDLLLTQLSSVLSTFDQPTQSAQTTQSDQLVSPSLFLIKTALRLKKVDLTKLIDKNYFTSETSMIAGKTLGKLILKSRDEVCEKKQELEKPDSLKQYQQSFPSFLKNFFDGMIIILEKRKHELANKKRRQRNDEEKPFDIINTEKKSAFLISIILTIAFPSVNIWLTHIMSSLCRKPKLLSSLYAILYTANAVSHTQSYERRLEKIRINEAKPKERLLTGENVWNVSVIDNIDFKEKTFAYGNIFDTTRNSSHATLRMVFQFLLPIPLDQINNDNDNNSNNDLILFGKSEFTNNLLKTYENIFNNLLQTYSDDWDINNFYDKIAEEIPIGPLLSILPPNIVILEPGENPNCNENVHNACEMYYDDVGILNSNHLDIVSDEAIFRRLISYHEKKDNVRLILGQWHTSKDMCSALITIFSGYGIFDLAANLGVRYLDKLEKVVDYQATCRVLELIWIAVGIAICKYLRARNKTIDDIEGENNDVLKVWYYYFCWAGYWFGHKQGIRRGNYDMQFKNLLAFSPLFPVAGKSNYARSVTYFLSYVNDDLTLQKLLQYVCSVNLTQPGHYFGFDEALERFGVMFVKQNISGNYMDNEELKHQITSVQNERDRLNTLLSEYVGDTALFKGERTVKSRKESLWKLAENLTTAFNLPDPTTHQLFKNAKEMNKKGFELLFSCYNHGISRLNSILQQDVYKTEERNVKGRRARNITTYKSQSLHIEKEGKKGKGKEKESVIDKNDNDNDDNNNNEGSFTKPVYRRKTSEAEKKILETLLSLETFPDPNDDEFINVVNVLQNLQKESTEWDLSRVKKYWSNHNYVKKRK